MTDSDQPVWRPLNVREGGDHAAYDALVDGIPPGLERSVWRWVADRAAEGSINTVYKAERRLHIELHEGQDRVHGTSKQPVQMIARYWDRCQDYERLVFLDFLLFDLQERWTDHVDSAGALDATAQRMEEAPDRLGIVMAEGGSLWTVQAEPPHWSLVRRVNDGTKAQIALVTEPSTDAARKIRSAWHACYRLAPDYDVAYRDAVRAVEAVAIPATIPNATTSGSLGTVAAHLRDTVDQWSVAGLDARQVASGQTLLAMTKTLWHNQERHARADGTIVDVSQVEAEAAVALATTLVQWFSAGLVTRSPKT